MVAHNPLGNGRGVHEVVGYSSGAVAVPVLEDIVWTNKINVTALGTDLYKTSGVHGAYDAGAVSSRAIVSGDGYMEFQLQTTAEAIYCGLSSSDPDQTRGTIKFTITGRGFAAPNTVAVFEMGNVKTGLIAYTAGNRLKVAIESSVVKYYNNGVLMYTSLTAPTYPMMADTSFYYKNAAYLIRSATIYGVLGASGY